MSSSPSLPSPSQLISGMPSHLPSGSRAAPIPKDAVAGFASASSILRQARFEGEKESGTTAKRLALFSKVEKAETEKENKKPSLFKKPKALLVEQSVPSRKLVECVEQCQVTHVAKSNEASAPKKSRKLKGEKEDDGQTKIKKTKITKPGTSRTDRKSKQKDVVAGQAKAKVSETFNTLLASQVEDVRAKEEFRDLCLDKAIPLRRQWTPCKDTMQDTLPEDTPKSALSFCPINASTENAPPITRFGQLLGDFGLAKPEVASAARPDVHRENSGEAVLKKRKIEIVQGIPAPLHTEKPKRKKSPKKKPQTITEKATAPFVSADSPSAPLLLQFFGAAGAPSGLPPCVEADDTGVVAHIKPRYPIKKTRKRKAVTNKTKTQEQPKLLSPETAMKNVGDQEILFGTSSQLAREDSPSLVRNIQEAIEESATMSQESVPSILPAGSFRTSTTVALAPQRNLWSFASRDLEGSLFEAETVDLSETPKPQKIQIEAVHPLLVSDPEKSQIHHEDDVEQLSVFKDLEPSRLSLQTTLILQQVQEPKSMIPRSVAEATLKKRPSNRSPVKNATNNKADPKQMPNYQGYTDAQLSKEVAAYGFKSIKRRVAMIALLEKCWESKISMAYTEAQANLNTQQPAAMPTETEKLKQASPGKKRGRPPKNTVVIAAAATAMEGTRDALTKKPRGRPKKDATATTPPSKQQREVKTKKKVQSDSAAIDADEIYDSSPPTPSPPRRRSASKSPRQLHLSQPVKASNNADKWSTVEDTTLLFKQMTKAVTTVPPTHSPQNLTFHEKILMYEPIVIEDLAAWLITQGLSRVDGDDKVWLGLVKEWCEERSLCCLWKENLRGGNRGRW